MYQKKTKRTVVPGVLLEVLKQLALNKLASCLHLHAFRIQDLLELLTKSICESVENCVVIILHAS